MKRDIRRRDDNFMKENLMREQGFNNLSTNLRNQTENFNFKAHNHHQRKQLASQMTKSNKLDKKYGKSRMNNIMYDSNDHMIHAVTQDERLEIANLLARTPDELNAKQQASLLKIKALMKRHMKQNPYAQVAAITLNS